MSSVFLTCYYRKPDNHDKATLGPQSRSSWSTNQQVLDGTVPKNDSEGSGDKLHQKGKERSLWKVKERKVPEDTETTRERPSCVLNGGRRRQQAGG